ncbi:hypothetical protein TNCV_1106341 [Trichonephila clavipes]|nr:hypothetical protein TNCV_1106341 [Trichonephila clavipes]
MLRYGFAILCKIRLGAQNLTLQGGPNILRYTTGLGMNQARDSDFPGSKSKELAIGLPNGFGHSAHANP